MYTMAIVRLSSLLHDMRGIVNHNEFSNISFFLVSLHKLLVMLTNNVHFSCFITIIIDIVHQRLGELTFTRIT